MKVAAVQMTSGADYHQNMSVAHDLIGEAALKGARLVLLPEMFACIGVTNQVSLAESYFTKEKLLATLGKWAKEKQVYIIAGSIPFSSDELDRVYAACFVFSPSGDVIAQYNKIHLFDVDVDDEKGSYRESNTFVSGQTPEQVDIDGNPLGLSICYDLRFPELYQHYQKNNCVMITVPSAFTYETGKKHWEVLLRARAIETQCFVIAANQVGLHEDGRQTWGHSMIVSPSGEVLSTVADETNSIAIADLDLGEMNLIRSAMPIKNHKRL